MSKVTIMLCPICGTELHITNQREFRCKCLNKLIVLGSRDERQIVKVEDAPAIRKAMQVRCKNCLSYRNGDCVDTNKPKRNVDKDCLRVCKRFIGYGG